MGWLLAKLASFIGTILAKLIAPLGREIRKNRTVKQTGADDETIDWANDEAWEQAKKNQPRRKK